MSATGTVHRRRAERTIDARVTAAVTVAIVTGLAVLVPRPSAAQESIEDVVSFLLVNRSIPTDDFVQDAQVAAATRDAISRAIVSGLATVPVSASASGPASPSRYAAAYARAVLPMSPRLPSTITSSSAVRA